MKRFKLLVIALLGIAITACQKNQEESDWNLDEALVYAEEQAEAELIFDDLESIAEDAESSELNFYKSANGRCMTVTRDTTATPPRIIVDFGNVNCLGLDSNYRRGQLIITTRGKARQQGWIRRIETRNFYFNDKQVIGAKTITQIAQNANGNRQFTKDCRAIVLSVNRQDTLYWSSNRKREMVAGASTTRIMDDQYEITGSSHLRSSFGRARSVLISTPLEKRTNCRWFSAGSIRLTNNQGKTALLNFGNGNCDRIATLSVNGRTRTIRL